MDNENHNQKLEEQREIKVKVFLKTLPLFDMSLKECEILGEVKLVLQENPVIKLHPNFSFYHKNKLLKEYVPLSEQISILSSSIDVQIGFGQFNQRTAFLHVFNLCQFFENPKYFMYNGFLEYNNLLGKNDYIQKALLSQELYTPNEIDLNQVLEGNLQVLKKFTFYQEQQTDKEYEEFFKELSYSKFNPPIGKGKIQGDLLYLDFISNENQSYCITINKTGVFVNETKKQEFSQKPQSQIFTNLLDLLCSLSQQFQICLHDYFNPNNQTLYEKYSEHFQLIKPNNNKFSKYIQDLQIYDKKNTQLSNLKDILKQEIYGQNLMYYRDWNEEFQNCKTLSSKDTIQQMQKLKILRKSQNDFINSSQELTKAVIQDSIVPLNPSENIVENCYVYNNLFATYAMDTINWEMPKTDVSPSTFSTINSDLKNLKFLFEQDIEDVNTINTCTVEYLGRRVIVQTVIQGILHFDSKTWNCYGTIDDGKTMTWNENFHEIMKKICDKFNITIDNVYFDQDNQKYVFHGSPEVKGIKAGDGRRYIMDLMRLSPRDTNFPDDKEHECCVIRNELINSYVFYNSIEQAYTQNQKKQQEQKQQQQKEEEQKKEELKKEEQKVEEQKKEEQKVEEKKVEEQKVEEQKVEEQKVEEQKVEEQKDQYVKKKFNTSLFTQIESKGDKVDQEREQLKQLSKFLRNNVIPVYVQNINSNPMIMPIDMEGLVESLHKNGINLRYLGEIYNLVNKTQNHYFKKLIERTVYVRGFIKYLRKLSLEIEVETLIGLFVNFVNLFLGNDLVREKLDQQNSNETQTENTQLNGEHKKKKKKNKKKKKKFEIQELINIKNCSYSKVSSQEFLNELNDIVQKRYQFSTENINNFNDLKFLKNPKEKMTFLRELCKHFGVQILPKKYEFNPNIDNFNLPFQITDITDYFPITKAPNYYSDLFRYNNKQIENEIQNKNFQGALQLLQVTQNMIINTYGLYNKEFIFNLSKIATILFQLKEIDQAIALQTFVIKLSEQVYGLDHFNTAFSILELSNFLFEKKQFQQCIQYHTIALFIFDLIGSPYNSNSFFCLHEIQVLLNEKKIKTQQKVVFEQLLERNSELFGQTDERLLFFLDKLALIMSEEHDFEKASLLQARHSLILGRVLKKPQMNEQYKTTLQLKLKESEKAKNSYMSKRKQLKNN